MTLVDGLIMWLHLICASIWVGGSIFLGIVLAPMLKTITKTIEERVSLMIKIGRRFNKIAIPSLGILIMTGIYNSRLFFMEPSALFSSNYGKVLFIKILLVIATIIVYIMHTRLLNIGIERKLASETTGSVFLLSVRSKVLYLGRITVILSVAILLAAALLVSGGL